MHSYGYSTSIVVLKLDVTSNPMMFKKSEFLDNSDQIICFNDGKFGHKGGVYLSASSRLEMEAIISSASPSMGICSLSFISPWI